MNAAQRREIERLRAEGVWEVAWAEVAVEVGDAPVERALVVVDTVHGPRHVGIATEGGLPPLADAFLAPLRGEPARPVEVRCADAPLRDALAEALDGLARVVAGATPLADALGTAVTASMADPPAPGIAVGRAAWRKALDRLLAVAPWSCTDDDGHFAYTGGDLEGAVGLFVGTDGELPGFLLFPSRDALDRFAAAVDGPPEGWTAIDQIALHLEPADALTPEERADCARLGFALPGERFPRLVAVDAGHVRHADDAEQARALRALEAALELCRCDPRPLADGAHATLETHGSDGVAVGVTWSVEDPDLLPFADHRLEVPSDGPRLVLTVAPADEERAREVLAGIDEVRAVRTTEGLVLGAWVDGDRAGTVSVFSADDADAIARVLHRAARIEVWLGTDERAPERVTGVPCRVS